MNNSTTPSTPSGDNSTHPTSPTRPSTGRQILDIALFFIMFLLIQMVVMGGGVKLYDMIKGAGSTNLLTNGNLMVGLTLLNSVVVGAVFMALRWSPFSRSYMQKRPWAVLIWTALLALGSIPLADALSSLTNVKMPAEELQLLTTLVTHPWGWIAVGVLVPIAEEMVFRGAILRTLLTLCGHRWRWGAIVLSALLFGLAHGNMAQLLNATLLGCLLGWLYYRSGSIAPGIVFHMVNNSVAVLLVRLMPGSADMQLVDLFAGDTPRLILFMLCALCVFVPSLWQLRQRL
ncbi:MAG: type II CAAX endopeptidase family protein [Prevotella sp.]|nr:type II CAAX endopeptidase family protein [Prevotella sp.]